MFDIASCSIISIKKNNGILATEISSNYDIYFNFEWTPLSPCISSGPGLFFL
jgi:hypothetical protein